MSQISVRELVDRLRARYLRASRPEKTKILDEFVATTGYHRKHAIRVLRHGYQRGRERRGRPRRYTGSAVSALVTVWRVCGGICGKRLAPFLPEMVRVLEAHDELCLDAATRDLVVQMSAATIDRKLAPYRIQRGRSTTRRGPWLKDKIPVRTFADWGSVTPGFVEADLVAHCGETTAGPYLNTLTTVDVVTGWTECFLLRYRSQQAVEGAMKQLQQRLPFPLLGLDCDNDGLFINGTLQRFCERHTITFTRARPYQSNDQAFVEQKNGAVVRGTVGYRRFTSTAAAEVLTAIYTDLHSYVNFFQPVRKLVVKQRTGAQVYKRYDVAQTPYQRALACDDVTPLAKAQLRRTYRQLNPAALRRQIDAHLRRLRQLPE